MGVVACDQTLEIEVLGFIKLAHCLLLGSCINCLLLIDQSRILAWDVIK